MKQIFKRKSSGIGGQGSENKGIGNGQSGVAKTGFYNLLDPAGFKKGISFGLGIIFTLLTSAVLAVAVTGTMNSFSSGNIVDASQINTNFASLKTAIEGITSSQWTSSGSNIYYNAGNVGIGTNSPGVPLDISSVSSLPSNVNGSVRLKGDFGTERIQFESSSGGGIHFFAYSGSNTSKSSVVNGQLLGFINGGGYDGTSINSTAGISFWSEENFTSSARGTGIRIVTASIGSAGYSEKMRITPNGNVGIGTSSPTALLHVAGTAGNTSGTWSSLSDERLKKNIFDYKGSLEKILNLRPVSFEWKENKEGRTAGRHIGFIAQEVEKIFPEWVSTMADGNKWMTPEGMNAVLVQSIREMSLRLRNLESRCSVTEHLDHEKSENAKLKQKLLSVEERLDALERMAKK